MTLSARWSSRTVLGAVAALVLALIGLGAAPARAAADTSGPVLVSLATSPASINVTTSSASVYVQLHLTDATGVATTAVTVTGPSAFTATQALDLDSGTVQDGTWSTSFFLAQGAAPGTYTVSDVLLEDSAPTPNPSDYGPTHKPFPSGSTSTVTVSRVADSAGPVLPSGTDLSLDHTTAATTSGSVVVRLGVHLTDDVSGVSSAEVTITGSAASDPFTTTVDLSYDADGTSGSPLNATLRGSFVIPEGTATQTLAITSLVVADGYGNTTTYGPGHTAFPTGTKPSVAVTGPGASPVTVTTITTSASAHDATSTAITVPVSVTVSSGTAKVEQISVTLEDPDGGYQAFDQPSRSTGTAFNGTYVAQLTVPQYAAPGAWHVGEVDVTDSYGRTTTIESAHDGTGAGAFAGHWPAITVTRSATPDTASPLVSTASLTPSAPNLASGISQADLEVVATITDNLSGVSDATAELTVAGDPQVVDLTRSAGTTLNGTWHGVLTVTAPGTVTLDSVTPSDAAGNGQQKVATGFAGTHSVTVTNNADTVAPTLTSSVTASPTSLDASTGPASTTLTFSFADPGSGLQDVLATYTSDDGVTTETSDGFTSGDLTSGSSYSGTAAVIVDFQPTDAAGTYHLTSLRLTDQAGNLGTFVGTAQLGPASGTDVTLTSSPDVTPPSITGVALSPTTVNSSAGPGVVTVSVTASDASGIDGGSVTLDGPNGASSFAGLDLEGPEVDATSGTFIAHVSIPEYNSAGSWHLSSVTVDDAAGNETSAAQGVLTGAGTVTVTSATDTTAPAVTALSFDPGSPLDATTSNRTLAVSAEITDAGSGGSDDQTVRLYPPGGGSPLTATLFRAGGTPADGTYTGNVSVSHFSTSGVYAVHVVTTDLGGASGDVSGAALPAGTSTFQINAVSDTTAPTVSAVTVTPGSVDTHATPAGADVTVTVSAQDGGSGVSSVFASFSPDHGVTELSDYSPAPTTGSAASGTWTLTLHVPQYSTSGTWSLDNLEVTDGNNNAYDVSDPSSQTAFPAAHFTVTAAADTTPPTVVSDSISTPSVDVSSSDGTVSGTVHATDAASGVSEVDVTLSAPAGTPAESATGSCAIMTPATDVTCTFTVPVPRGGRPGTWTLTRIQAYDANGNLASYGGVSEPAEPPLPTPASVSVTDSSPDTSAPTLVNGIVLDQSAVNDVSSAASVQASLHVQDAGGFDHATATVHAPDGSTDDLYFGGVSTGTANDGIATATVVVPQGSPSGTWSIDSLQLVDELGNTAANPATASFTVTGPAVATPSAPVTFAATAGDGTAHLTWSAPTSSGSAGAVTGYHLSSSPVLAGVQTLGAAVTSFDYSGLTNGTTYTFTLTAFNGSGDGTPATTTATPAAGPPGALAGLSVTGGNQSVTATWTATPGATGYTVTYTPGGTTPVTVSGTTDTITGLTPGTTYSVTVTPTNGAGSGTGATLSAKALALPGAPTGVTAVPHAGSNTSADVAWTAPASDGGATIDHYTVTATPSVGSAVQATVPSGTSTTLTGLAAGTTYTVSVTAHTQAGDGQAGTASTAVTTTDAVPGTPVAPTAVAGPGAGQITVSVTPPANTGSAIDHYTLTPSTGSPVVITGTSTVLSGLTVGTAYTFTVKAHNAKGDSPVSPASAPATPYTTPGIVTGVTTTPHPGSVDVSWTAPATGGNPIDHYIVAVSGAAPLVVAGTSTTVTGLAPATGHTVTVTAHNAAGNGPTGAAASFTTTDVAPAAVGGLAAVAGDKKVTVSWTAPAANGGTPVTGYVVTVAGKTLTVPGTSLVVTGLTNGKSVSASVTPVNAAGSGPASVVSAIPKAPWKPAKAKAPKVLTAKTKVTFTTTVSGSTSSTKVQLQSLVGKVWKTVATFKLDKKHKTWSTKLSLPAKGKKLQLRVHVSPDKTHADTVSATTTVKAV